MRCVKLNIIRQKKSNLPGTSHLPTDHMRELEVQSPPTANSFPTIFTLDISTHIKEERISFLVKVGTLSSIYQEFRCFVNMSVLLHHICEQPPLSGKKQIEHVHKQHGSLHFTNKHHLCFPKPFPYSPKGSRQQHSITITMYQEFLTTFSRQLT